MEVISLVGKNAEEIKKAMDSGKMVYIGGRMDKHHFPNVRKKWGWLKDSPWRNENKAGTLDDKIESFRHDLLNSPILLKRLPELKGKTLACWCKPERCHGDVLVEFVERL